MEVVTGGVPIFLISVWTYFIFIYKILIYFKNHRKQESGIKPPKKTFRNDKTTSAVKVRVTEDNRNTLKIRGQA